MAKLAPSVSFSVTSINYGTIDVGTSSAMQSYKVYQARNSTSYANAINMSICFVNSYNSSEAQNELWCFISTAHGSGYIGSEPGSEVYAGSLVAAKHSHIISTLVSVPTLATSAGRVAFYLHHRYQYTGDDS